MDFQKKYPLLQFPNEHITIQWERGYKYVELFYKDRLLGSITGMSKLKKGVKFNDAELGLIELRLSEAPIAIDLIVGGYHSPVNITYPTKELKSASTIFWVLAVFSMIIGIYEGVSATMYYGSLVGVVIASINFILILIYSATAILIHKGHAWTYFVGGGIYTFFTLLNLFDLLAYGFYLVPFFIALFRVVVTFMLAYYFKHALASIRHRKYEGKNANKIGASVDILDS